MVAISTGTCRIDSMMKNKAEFTREEVQALVAAAVKSEREACAELVETQETYGDCVGSWFDTLAANIRNRS